VLAMTRSRDKSPVGGAVERHGTFAQKPCRRAIFVLGGFVWLVPPMLRADGDRSPTTSSASSRNWVPELLDRICRGALKTR